MYVKTLQNQRVHPGRIHWYRFIFTSLNLKTKSSNAIDSTNNADVFETLGHTNIVPLIDTLF